MKLGSKPLSHRVVSEIVIINFETNYFWSTADVDDDVDDETSDGDERNILFVPGCSVFG